MKYDGTEECPCCQGTGRKHYTMSNYNLEICDFCKGDGSISWIQYIFYGLDINKPRWEIESDRIGYTA